MNIGERVKTFRAESGLSQLQLARRAGVVQPAVSLIERGAVEAVDAVIESSAGLNQLQHQIVDALISKGPTAIDALVATFGQTAGDEAVQSAIAGLRSRGLVEAGGSTAVVLHFVEGSR